MNSRLLATKIRGNIFRLQAVRKSFINKACLFYGNRLAPVVEFPAQSLPLRVHLNENGFMFTSITAVYQISDSSTSARAFATHLLARSTTFPKILECAFSNNLKSRSVLIGYRKRRTRLWIFWLVYKTDQFIKNTTT